MTTHSDTPLTLAGGRLSILSHPYRLDGRVTTYPADMTGYACMNTCVLREGTSALLIDSGWSADEARLLSELEAVLDGTTAVSALPLRYGEFGGLCNYRAVAARFRLERIYGRVFGGPHEWLDFRPHGGAEPLRSVPAAPMRSNERVAVDTGGRRVLQLLVAPLRLLPMPWAYDAVTRTLFTADVFGWVTRPHATGPWLLADGDPDPTQSSHVERFLLDNRYWWLAGARVGRLRDDLDALFARCAVETIVPGTGCVLHGRATVERHLALLREALDRAACRRSIGIEIGRLGRRRAA